jgi:hypothetical protein
MGPEVFRGNFMKNGLFSGMTCIRKASWTNCLFKEKKLHKCVHLEILSVCTDFYNIDKPGLNICTNGKILIALIFWDLLCLDEG